MTSEKTTLIAREYMTTPHSLHYRTQRAGRTAFNEGEKEVLTMLLQHASTANCFANPRRATTQEGAGPWAFEAIGPGLEGWIKVKNPDSPAMQRAREGRW
jgi:hypothetical protein